MAACDAVISVAGAVVDDGWIGSFAPELISFGASLDGNGTLATAGSIELFTPTDTPLGDGQYPETFYELGEISVAGAVMGSLTFLIGTLGSLALAADAAPTDRIMLTGETAGLLLSVGPTFAMDAPISGFEATDTITIADASTIASALFTQTGAAGGTLALMDAARDVLGDLTLEGTYAPHQFAVASSSGAGGIVTNTITLTAPCFAAGTRVATPGGAVAVERLRVGEAVLTAAGAVRRIRWIGHRDVACRRHPEPTLVLPVRIEAGAFAPGCPKRPLLLSPDHAVFVEAVLVPIKYLINGRSIRQVTVEEVGYWHVELAQGRAPGPHFDPAWYRATYAIAPTHSALAHYLAHRRTWRVSPNPRFDVAIYIRALGGALLPGRDPYAHYRAFGQRAEVDDRWLAA